MYLSKTLEKQLIAELAKVKPYQVILFGSYANGTPNNDSDIDLVVILNKSGFCNSYSEVIQNKKIVSEYLHELRKTIPIDLLVYTKDEWSKLISSDSSFFNNIQKNGIKIL